MNPNDFIRDNKRSTCECGAPNNCAMEQGKSISACWCVGEDFADIPPSDTGTCYCKDCLRGKIDE